MNIKTSIPQIAVLRSEVEQKVGFKPTTHAQFIDLMSYIENQLKEHMSETTLERVWEYSTRGYDSVSTRTLDVLSRIAGYSCWNDFCHALHTKSHIESEMFTANTISSSDLNIGARLRIGWQPNRVCIIRYLGDNRFVAEETENSSIKPGDSFSCLIFQKNRELYMDYFAREGEVPCPSSRYVVGQQNGLTTLEILA